MQASEKTIIQLTTQEKNSREDKIFAYRAMGDFFRIQEKFDKSIKAFQMANSLKFTILEQNEITFDSKELNRHSSDIIKFFSSHYFSEPNPIGNQDIEPIVIIGSPHLGTETIARSIPGEYIGCWSNYNSILETIKLQ